MFKVAGIVFEAGGCGELFRARAEKYRVTEGDPEFLLSVSDEELGSMSASMPDEAARYLLSGTKFYIELIKRGGMMLHSSAVAYRGKAYLFSGPSGVGKSTHTGHWLELFPEAYILNDDKPALIPCEGGAAACGTPWSGKYDISQNETLPVGGIAFIERAPMNFIKPLSAKEAAFDLISQTVRHISRERMEQLLSVVERVIENVPIYSLGCTNDKSAAELACRAMVR